MALSGSRRVVAVGRSSWGKCPQRGRMTNSESGIAAAISPDNAGGVVSLRSDGRLQIMELPPTSDIDDYDFENPWPNHIVNCPTPMTVDSAIYTARFLDQ